MSARRRLVNAIFLGAVAVLGIATVVIVVVRRVDTAARREATAREIQECRAEYLRDPTNRRPLEKIIEFARGRYSFGKSYALMTLGKMQLEDTEVLGALVEGLKSGDGFVRDSASQALSRMGAKARPAKHGLAEAIRRYPEERTALFAVEALEHIGDADPDIVESLRFAESTTGDSFAREEAGRALKEIGKKRGQ